MGQTAEITDFKSYLWEVVLKPWWVALIFGGLVTTFGVFCLVRDQAMPTKWQDKLATPHFGWRVWLVIILVAALVSVIRNGYAVWSYQFDEIRKLKSASGIRQNEGLPLTAPQVNLVAETQPEMGRIDRVLLRNLSNDPLYNLAFQPVTLRESIFINWKPNDVPLLEGASSVVIRPAFTRAVGGGPGMEFDGVAQLMAVLRQDENRSWYNIGRVSFSCEDKLQNRYLVTFTVEVNFPGNVLILKDTEKVLIGNRPNTYSPSTT